MMESIRRFLRWLASFLLPARVRRRLMADCRKLLDTEHGRELSDELMEFLLKGMDEAFCLFRSYRKNIRGFSGKYVFATRDKNHEKVECSAIFENGNMWVEENAVSDPNVKIVFENSQALWAFIFSENQDIIDSLLKDDVQVEGNLNYVYRFGFLARELAYTLGLV